MKKLLLAVLMSFGLVAILPSIAMAAVVPTNETISGTLTFPGQPTATNVELICTTSNSDTNFPIQGTVTGTTYTITVNTQDINACPSGYLEVVANSTDGTLSGSAFYNGSYTINVTLALTAVTIQGNVTYAGSGFSGATVVLSCYGVSNSNFATLSSSANGNFITTAPPTQCQASNNVVLATVTATSGSNTLVGYASGNINNSPFNVSLAVAVNTYVSGVVYNHLRLVNGASVTVTCNSYTLTTTSNMLGLFSVQFPLSECVAPATASVTASQGTLVGSSSATVYQLTPTVDLALDAVSL
jgi:hypothetical protein